MDGYQIRRLLANETIKVNDLAEFFGVSHAAVSQVIHGKSKSYRISNAIATFVGKSVSELWPETPQTKNTLVPAGRNTPSVGCLVGTEDPSRD